MLFLNILSNLLFIFALLWMFFFAVKLSKKKSSTQRKFFCLSAYFLIGWIFFDFLTANAWSVKSASLFYALATLCISAMVSFFYLTTASFMRELKAGDFLISSIPLILDAFRILYASIASIKGVYKIFYNSFDEFWMLICVVIILFGAYELLKISSLSKKTTLRNKMRRLSISLILIASAAPVSTIILNSLNVVDFTSVIAAFLFSLNYKLFN